MNDTSPLTTHPAAKAQFSTRHIRYFAEQLRREAQAMDGNDTRLKEALVPSSIRSIARVLTFTDKLLRKAIKRFKLSPRSVDGFTANALLRHAGLHGLLTAEQVERLLVLRIAHVNRAAEELPRYLETVAPLLPQFAADLDALADRLEAVLNSAD